MPVIPSISTTVAVARAVMARAAETQEPDKNSTNTSLIMFGIIGGTILGGGALLCMIIWCFWRTCGKGMKKVTAWWKNRSNRHAPAIFLPVDGIPHSFDQPATIPMDSMATPSPGPTRGERIFQERMAEWEQIALGNARAGHYGHSHRGRH